MLPFRRKGLTLDGVRFDDGGQAMATLLAKVRDALEQMQRDGFHQVKLDIQITGRKR